MDIRTPNLIFQGDARAGRKWLPYARKALANLKKFRNAGIDDQTYVPVVNQVFRPIGGTVIHVKSVNNHDYIRIMVDEGGKKKCQVLASYELTGSLEITLTLRFRKRDTEAETETAQYFILFGDGEGEIVDGTIDTEITVTHTYQVAGDYTAEIIGWARKEDITGVILGGEVDVSALQVKEGFRKQSQDQDGTGAVFASATWQKARDSFLADPWTSQGPSVLETNDVSYSVSSFQQFFPPPTLVRFWSMSAEKVEITTDLTGFEETDKFMAIASAIPEYPLVLGPQDALGPTSDDVGTVFVEGVAIGTIPHIRGAPWRPTGEKNPFMYGMGDMTGGITSFMSFDNSNDFSDPMAPQPPIDPNFNSSVGWTVPRDIPFTVLSARYFPYHCKAGTSVSMEVT